MLYDFHTHLYLYQDDELFLDDLEKNNIFCVTSSTDVISWNRDQTIAKSNKNIVSTFGIHPSKISVLPKDLSVLNEMVLQSPIIGEIGLDRKWCQVADFERQKEVFEYFLRACCEQDKYCVVHTAGAEEECLRMLKFNGCKKVVIHWYDGPSETLKAMIDEGWYFTFSPALKYCVTVRDLLLLVPLDRVLSETDGPETEAFLGGDDRSPSLLIRVIEDMARIRGLSIIEMEKVLECNSTKILRESGIGYL